MFMLETVLSVVIGLAVLPRCVLVIHNCISNLSPAHPCSLRVLLLFNGHSTCLSPGFYAVGRGSENLPFRFEKGASKLTTCHDLATLPSEASQRAQPRASTSAALPPLTAETQANKQAARTEPATGQRATQAQPSVQEEGSGYMSTESDSDTGTNKKTQVRWWQLAGGFMLLLDKQLTKFGGNSAHILQRKAASAGAQTTRDCKGHGRQMITMAFLEEGGYFDVPIQVKVTPGTFLLAHDGMTCQFRNFLVQSLVWCGQLIA